MYCIYGYERFACESPTIHDAVTLYLADDLGGLGGYTSGGTRRGHGKGNSIAEITRVSRFLWAAATGFLFRRRFFRHTPVAAAHPRFDLRVSRGFNSRKTRAGGHFHTTLRASFGLAGNIGTTSSPVRNRGNVIKIGACGIVDLFMSRYHYRLSGGRTFGFLKQVRLVVSV